MKLKKELGFIDIFCIACGAMISSGIFILPGMAFTQVGPAVVISYFIAGIISILGILSVVELATAMPKAGGDYYFITRSLGPMLGTVSGLLSWFALSLKSCFAIFGLAELIHLWTGVSLFPIGLAVTAAFVVLNIVGVKEAAKFEVFLALGLIILMLVFIIFGMPHVEISSFDPILFEGRSALHILSTAGFVFISFGGLLNVASISEELKNPRRNLPLGMLSSIIVITVLYTLILVVTVGLLPAENLKNSMTPIADTAKIFFGQPGFIIITIAAIMAFLTTANAGIMSAARYPLALSRDELLPGFFKKLNRRFQTPTVTLAATGILISLSLLMDLEMLVKAASTVILTSYLLASISIIILRESKIQNYRPSFKTPLYPWLQIVNILIFIALIFDMGLQAIEISLGLIFICLIIYYIYGRKSNQEYALLHLIERIMDKKLTNRGLEEELKEVVNDRDEIVKDEFDHLIEKAAIFDFDEKMQMNDFFDKVSKLIAERKKKMTAEKTMKMLKEREAESSTALTPLVAIPHIIAEGEGIFDIFIARNSAGINFSTQHSAVKAVFIIIGTRDKRNLHLRSLAAIAQLIQNPDFEENWLNAPDQESLRDLLLLGKRKRNA